MFRDFLDRLTSGNISLETVKADQVFGGQSKISLRQYIRIAVIDDEAFQPLENLIFEGFNIAYIGNHCRVEACQPYHIILCDVSNVGCDFNQGEQGSAVIKEIRRLYPQKYVIVYSGLDRRSQNLRTALERSHDFISKTSQLDTYCAVLDNGIDWITDPLKVWDRAHQQLVDLRVGTKEISRLENAYARAVHYRDPTRIRDYSKSISSNETAKAVAINLLSSAIWAILLPGGG